MNKNSQETNNSLLLSISNEHTWSQCECNGLLQKRLEKEFCWVIPHVPPNNPSSQGTDLNWTDSLRLTCLTINGTKIDLWWWFFLACKDFGTMFDHSFPACAFFLFLLICRLARTPSFHSLGQDQSTVAQKAEMTATECSQMSCVWAHFLIGSHIVPGQPHSQSTPTSLGQGCMHVSGQPANYIFGRIPASFMCHCSNTRVEGTPSKSQHRKLTLEKKILPPLLPGFEPATFWSEVRCFTNQLSQRLWHRLQSTYKKADYLHA